MFEVLPLVVWLSVLLVAFAAGAGYTLTQYLALRRCDPQNRTMTPGFVWLQMIPVWGLFWWFVNVGVLGESLEKDLRSRGVAAHRPHQSLGKAAGWLAVVVIVLLAVDYALFAVVETTEASGGDPRGDRRLAIAILVVAGAVLVAFFAMWIMYCVKIIGTWRRMAGLGPVKSDGLQYPAAPVAQPQSAGASRAQGFDAGAPWAQTPAATRAVAGTGPAAVSPSRTRSGPRSGPALDFCKRCGLLAPVGQLCPRCGAQVTRGGGGHSSEPDGAE